MILAILPACGDSTRMGRPKLLLDIAGRTVLERVLAALQAAGVDRVLVVAHPAIPGLKESAERAGAAVIVPERPTADMRETVLAGLRHAQDVWRPGEGDAWLLTPADYPCLDPGAIRELLAAWGRLPGQTILVPVYEGRRGHPVLLAWKHARELLAAPTGQGINQYIRSHFLETLLVPTTSAGAVLDLDTPEDYGRLCGGIPFPE